MADLDLTAAIEAGRWAFDELYDPDEPMRDAIAAAVRAAAPIIERAVRRRYYLCRRCGALRGDWEIFSYGRRTERFVCLDHIPWWVRLRMRIREWWNPDVYA